MISFRSGDCYWRRQFMTYHPVIGWWFIPEISARLPMDDVFYTVRTNSVGMRADREYDLAKPPGVTRLVVLGDSYSAADGCNNRERYTDLLEAALPGLEILNFACPNTGTDQQILIYEHIASRFEHDAVVMAVLVENMYRCMQTCRPAEDPHERVAFLPKPYFTLDGGKLTLHNQPVPVERRHRHNLGDWHCDWPYHPEYPADPLALYRFPEGDYWQVMRAIIERGVAAAGRPVFLMPLPLNLHYLQKADAGPYMTRFAEVADSLPGVTLVDPLPDFLALPLEERRECQFPSNPHYTPRAQRVVAEALGRELAAWMGGRKGQGQ